MIAASEIFGIAVAVGFYFGGNAILRHLAGPLSVEATETGLVLRYESFRGSPIHQIPWAELRSVSWNSARVGQIELSVRAGRSARGGFFLVTDESFLAELQQHMSPDRLVRLGTPPFSG